MWTTTYTYLGIEVAEVLGWQYQTEVICKKVSAGTAALKHIYPLVPHQTLLRMYEALVLPYLDNYCGLGMHGENPVWQTPEIAT